MQPFFKSLLVSSLIATAGFASYAQTTDKPTSPPAGQSAGAPERGARMGKMGKMDPEKRKAMMAKHIDALKAKLKITAAQEGAWTTFTTAMKPANRAEMKRPDRAELDKLPTPERIDKMRALRNERMAAMNAEMDKREDATKAFYATLNADQKKAFDSAHARMGRHHGEHRGAGRMGDMRTKPQQPQ